jgi:hypothetical protein
MHMGGQAKLALLTYMILCPTHMIGPGRRIIKMRREELYIVMYIQKVKMKD